MFMPFLVAASGLFCLTVVMAFGLTRRYGWQLAILTPILALLAVVGMAWQSDQMDIKSGLSFGLFTTLASAPILLGTAVGILLARRRRG